MQALSDRTGDILINSVASKSKGREPHLGFRESAYIHINAQTYMVACIHTVHTHTHKQKHKNGDKNNVCHVYPRCSNF